MRGSRRRKLIPGHRCCKRADDHRGYLGACERRLAAASVLMACHRSFNKGVSDTAWVRSPTRRWIEAVHGIPPVYLYPYSARFGRGDHPAADRASALRPIRA